MTPTESQKREALECVDNSQFHGVHDCEGVLAACLRLADSELAEARRSVEVLECVEHCLRGELSALRAEVCHCGERVREHICPNAVAALQADLARVTGEREAERARAKVMEEARDTVLDLRRAGRRLSDWFQAVIDGRALITHWRTADSVSDMNSSIELSYKKVPSQADINSSPSPANKHGASLGTPSDTKSPAKEPESMEAKWSEPCGSCPHDWGSHSSDGECAADRCYCLHFCPPAVEKPCQGCDNTRTVKTLATTEWCPKCRPFAAQIGEAPKPAVAPVESLTEDEGCAVCGGSGQWWAGGRLGGPNRYIPCPKCAPGEGGK